MFLYSNEIVFRGHPDKVCDQISDAILTSILNQDPSARCGIETMGGKGNIYITGEIKSNIPEGCLQDVISDMTCKTLQDVGYNSNKYMIINNVGVQSPDIAMGVDIGGAGDQGMMFGFATRETDKMLPKAMVILQEFAQAYDNERAAVSSLRPDGKAQITGYYDDNFNLQKIKTFTISYQNDETRRKYTDHVVRELATKVCDKYGIEVEEFLMNPTGRFELGGFEADAGLTGRKIVVDNYHSFANVGGGAFSGKDCSKVDRSAAYKARQIAIQYLNRYQQFDKIHVQLSYAIGVDKPLAIYINSDKGPIKPRDSLYDECTPNNIIKEFDLRNFDYTKTAQFGHFGFDFPWERV